jgi:4'-phosphopantetheinyl transferase
MSLEKPAPGVVHLYEVNLDTFQFTDVLSEDERARAARFRFDHDRLRYTAGRCAMRCVLASYLNKNPRALIFSYNPAGKPELPGIQFNLAHSGPHALLAIASEARVGVDIEQVRLFPHMDDVAKSVFTPRELQRWRALPDDQRPDRFYRLWTRKEAYLKAIGEGIAHRLQQTEVTFDNPPEIFVGVEGPWTLRDVSKSERLIAAVAYEGRDLSIDTYFLGAG